jgi:hypothetical protein
MFAREFLCFYPARRSFSGGGPPLASRQNSPKSNDSPTYAPLRRKSNDSPTYAKTGGWGLFPAPTFKYHLKCRRADISSFTEPSLARRSFSEGGPLACPSQLQRRRATLLSPHHGLFLSISYALFHFSYHLYLPSLQSFAHSFSKNRGVYPLRGHTKEKEGWHESQRYNGECGATDAEHWRGKGMR